MTTKVFQKLPPGTPVQWREGANSPCAGEVTEFGIVVHEGPRHFVEWPDGQLTEADDHWALENVELRSGGTR